MADATDTVTWFAPNGDCVEVEAPVDVVEAWIRGEAKATRDAIVRRWTNEEALEALRNRRAAIEERINEFKAAHPELRGED